VLQKAQILNIGKYRCMPQTYDSLDDQLDLGEVITDHSNFKPVRKTSKEDAKVDGSSTPVELVFDQWDDLLNPPNPEVRSIGDIIFTGIYSSATPDNTLFFGAAALANGVDVAIRKGGVTSIIGNFKNIFEMEAIFDEVTTKQDGAATPNNTVTGRMKMSKEDGIFLQLKDNLDQVPSVAKDAVIFTINDDLTGVGVQLEVAVDGFGYVPNIKSENQT